MRLLPEWRLRLIGLLLIASVGVGGYVLHADRTHTTTRETALVAAVAAAKVVATADSATHVVAIAATDRVLDTLHRHVVLYDTVRATIILEPRTAADTAHDIATLPALVHESDALRHGIVALTDTLHTERASAARLDADRVRTIATQDSLVTLLRHVPRLSGVASGLYDPVARVGGALVHVDARVVGAWSVGALGEYRAAPGERARGYLTLSHPLF